MDALRVVVCQVDAEGRARKRRERARIKVIGTDSIIESSLDVSNVSY